MMNFVCDDDNDEGSFEGNQDGSHVVASDAWHGVSGNQPLEEVLNNLLGVLLFDLLFYDIYDSLVVVNVVLPNTITS